MSEVHLKLLQLLCPQETHVSCRSHALYIKLIVSNHTQEDVSLGALLLQMAL